ncbi:FG-GAP repeat protein [bacterium]|nr:FG-GAP repeat protein [bacterium]
MSPRNAFFLVLPALFLTLTLCKTTYGLQFQERKIVSLIPEEGGYFGRAVATAGDYLLIGAPYEDNANMDNGGRIYTYQKDSEENWNYLQTHNGYEALGSAIGATDAHALIAKSTNVSFFTMSPAGIAFNMSVPNSMLYAADDIAINGDVAIFSYTQEGTVFIYRKTSPTVWTLEDQLAPQRSNTTHTFGISVGISGGYAVVGHLQDLGYVDIYKRDAATSDWDFMQTLMVPVSFEFGRSVTMVGTDIVVGRTGGSGAVYLYKKEPGLDAWSLATVGPLTTTDYTLNQSFGVSVAYDGEQIAVGCNGAQCSAVYLFREDETGWYQAAKLTSADPGSTLGDSLGTQVAINGDDIIAGAPFYGSSWGEGAVFIFTEQTAPGDISGNGSTDLADVITSLKVMAGESPTPLIIDNDIDGSGRIELSYSIQLLQILVDPDPCSLRS